MAALGRERYAMAEAGTADALVVEGELHEATEGACLKADNR